MVICFRLGVSKGMDVWIDAGSNLFCSPTQFIWPPLELDGHGFPRDWEFVCFRWDTAAWVASIPFDEPEEEGDAPPSVSASASAPSSQNERNGGGKLIACRTRVSERNGGQIYIVSPKTNMEIVVPFTRYDDLGDLLEKIQAEFAEGARDSLDRKPWVFIDYTPEELALVASLATQKRKSRFT